MVVYSFGWLGRVYTYYGLSRAFGWTRLALGQLESGTFRSTRQRSDV